MQFVTKFISISLNNVVLRQKIRTSEAKRPPQLAERWVYEQLLGDLLYFS